MRVRTRRWLFLTAAGLAILAAVACGSANSAAPEPSAAPPPPAVIVNVVHSVAPPEAERLPATVVDRSVPAPAGSAETAPSAVITAIPQAETPRPQAVTPLPQAAAPDLSPDEIMAAQEEWLTGLYQRVMPSVVHIHVTQELEGGEAPALPGFDDFFSQGEGSGFVWDAAGHIVTNHHVVDGADRVFVVFADQVQIEATVLGGDSDSDLAVLRLEELDRPVTPVSLGDSDLVQVGQIAVAIGAPFGQEFTMTTGIVSGIGRTIHSGGSRFAIPEVIQTDAALNPGNSGGPLLNRHGQVIGINTQIISRSGSNAGVGLAVPINTARKVVPALIEDGRYDHSWLGITGMTMDPDLARILDFPGDTRGVLVIEVVEDSPADQAGLRGSDETTTVNGVEYPADGDLIVGVDGHDIRGMDELITYLSGTSRPGDLISLSIMRDGDGPLDLPVTLGTRPRE